MWPWPWIEWNTPQDSFGGDQENGKWEDLEVMPPMGPGNLFYAQQAPNWFGLDTHRVVAKNPEDSERVLPLARCSYDSLRHVMNTAANFTRKGCEQTHGSMGLKQIYKDLQYHIRRGEFPHQDPPSCLPDYTIQYTPHRMELVRPISPNEFDADIIFVHGLWGNLHRTWSIPGTNRPWSTEFLLDDESIYGLKRVAEEEKMTDVPNTSRIRVLTAGLENPILDGFFQGHSIDFESSFESLKHSLQNAQVGQKPIVWVAHSVGGILVKRLLNYFYDITLERGNHPIWKNTRGIIFFATPHAGSDFIASGRDLGALNLSEDGIAFLRKGNSVLENMNRFFRSKGEHIGLFSFVETAQLPYIPEEIAQAGLTLIADAKSSMSQNRTAADSELCAGRTHTSICQFERPDDPYLRICTKKIAEFLNAPAKRQRRGSAVIPAGGFSVAEKHAWKNLVFSRVVRFVQAYAQIPSLDPRIKQNVQFMKHEISDFFSEELEDAIRGWTGPREGMEDAMAVHFFKLVLQHQHLPELNEEAIEETVRQVLADLQERYTESDFDTPIDNTRGPDSPRTTVAKLRAKLEEKENLVKVLEERRDATEEQMHNLITSKLSLIQSTNAEMERLRQMMTSTGSKPRQ